MPDKFEPVIVVGSMLFDPIQVFGKVNDVALNVGAIELIVPFKASEFVVVKAVVLPIAKVPPVALAPHAYNLNVIVVAFPTF